MPVLNRKYSCHCERSAAIYLTFHSRKCVGCNFLHQIILNFSVLSSQPECYFTENSHLEFGDLRATFFQDVSLEVFMSLRACEGEAIQLLPILKGRNLVEHKSPKCPVLGTKMSAYLHILSQYCTQKQG